MKALFIIATCFIMTHATAWSRTIEDILAIKESKMPRYTLKTTVLDNIVINMGFANSTTISPVDKAKLKEANVIQIDLVFSDFPKNADLTALNNQRIKTILQLRGDLVKDSQIQWRIIRQVACKNEAEAQTLFHGIVVHYQAAFSPEDYTLQQTNYRSLLNKEDATRILQKEVKIAHDTTIIKVLGRKNWNKPTIVTDVTGSMQPYIMQIAYWHLLKLKESMAVNYILFNDGDNTPNLKKKTGATGGIYQKSTEKYQEFINLVITATSNGHGGDIQENGVEALLEAQRLNPNAKELIYIADNFAPLRDIELAHQIKVPVRVIVCGSNYSINLHLLQLAYITKGSIHTIEQDIEDLHTFLEGIPFKIGKESFSIKDGKVTKI